jgi:hypothetical protein
MIVAQEKRKTNIAEYIIYLWQVEDMIRALNFDMDKIESTLVAGYDVDEAKKVEISEWYKHHIVMMQKERIQKSGHLQVLVMLKMKKQEISEGTQKAVWKFGNFMGHLSKLYKAYESGDLDLTY